MLTLVLSAACGLFPVRAQAQSSPQDEKARSAVATLRARDDATARRDLHALGGSCLPPLAEALAQEADPAAWTRLSETFEAVLRVRLDEMDKHLGRIARDLEEQQGAGAGPEGEKRPPAGLPIAAPTGVTAAAIRAIEEEVRAAGFPAARELARPAALRDEFSTLVRAELLRELFERLRAEGAKRPPGSEERLANMGPLVAPLLARAIAEKGDLGALAGKARDLAVARYARLLASDLDAERRFAEEALFGMGELARPALERLSAEGSPDEKRRAARLRRRVDWGFSEALYRRTGHLLEGFEGLPWHERRMTTYELEKQGRADALPALRRILERDPSLEVKVAAAEALARQGDHSGVAYLQTLGRAPLTQSPEVLAAIAMDQGIRYLQIHRYERAIEEFRRVLETDPENEIAHYNLACAFALRLARDGKGEDRDAAFEALDLAIKHGFEDYEHMLKDKDLTSLRKELRFKETIRRLKQKKGVFDAPEPETEPEAPPEAEPEKLPEIEDNRK